MMYMSNITSTVAWLRQPINKPSILGANENWVGLPSGGIEIICWKYSAVLGNKDQIRIQVLILRTWTCFHQDSLF